MSELSPLTAARLGELALEAGIPAGVLNVVHGYGAEAGEPLCRHPDVRAISFTGSTVTGNRIVRAAGLKKFSMELGGKSPFVVFADADLGARARRRAVHDVLEQRRALHGRLAHPGAASDLRRVRGALRRARAAHHGRRPAGREDPARPDDQRRSTSPRCAATSSSAREEGATLLCGGLERPATPELPAAVRRATTCGRRCSPTSTTACASRRRRSSGRWRA